MENKEEPTNEPLTITAWRIEITWSDGNQEFLSDLNRYNGDFSANLIDEFLTEVEEYVNQNPEARVPTANSFWNTDEGRRIDSILTGQMLLIETQINEIRTLREQVRKLEHDQL